MVLIKRISIKDYRSCRDTLFDLQPDLSVLVGPNGSGKTNILNALLLLQKLADQNRAFRRTDEKPTAQSLLKVWFEVNGKELILTANIDSSLDEQNRDVIIRSAQKWYIRDFTGDRRLHALSLSMSEMLSNHYFITKSGRVTRLRRDDGPDIPKDARAAISEIAKTVRQARYYGASQFTNPGSCPGSFEVDSEGDPEPGIRNKAHAKFLFDLYSTWKYRRREYSQYAQMIGKEGIGLIDEMLFATLPTSSVDYYIRSGGRPRKRTRRKELVVPRFKIGHEELAPNQLSEGTFKTISLIFYLMTDKSSLLLVEEPEVCVHQGLLASIISLVRAYGEDKQVVISTHSDFVLDKLDARNVYSVSNNRRTGTKIKHVTSSLSQKQLGALRHYLETEGNLGEYWRHGGLE